MAISERRITADDVQFMAGDGRRQGQGDDWAAMPMLSAEDGRIAARVVASLQAHVGAWRLGAVYGPGTGFMLESDQDAVRSPDVAFVTRERVKAAGKVLGYWRGAPDLAVEIISPSDRYSEVEDQIDAWLEGATRMIIVLNPRRGTAMLHRPATPVRALSAGEVLGGEDIVPGWSVALAELFAEDMGD